MKQYIVDERTPLNEVAMRFSLLGKRLLLCVVKEKKLLGIITLGDVLRFLLESEKVDKSSATAYEVSNKNFTKLTLTNLENELNSFLKENNNHIKRIPIVDSENNLVTIIDVNSLQNIHNWQASQQYEINFWCGMENELLEHIKDNQNIFIKRARPPIPWEIEPQIEKDIINHIENKSVLDVGCGPACGFLPYLHFVKKRIAIEPLLEKYSIFWSKLAGINMEDIIDEKYPIGADSFIPELAGKIDGMIISSNALDHTPNWAFILSNISSYAAIGSYLYLWTDIHHPSSLDSGHYNITPYADNIYRMIENLGFKLLTAKTRVQMHSGSLLVSLVAIKTDFSTREGNYDIIK